MRTPRTRLYLNGDGMVDINDYIELIASGGDELVASVVSDTYDNTEYTYVWTASNADSLPSVHP